MNRRALSLVVALLGSAVAHAQPAPDQGDKVDAKALMQSGLRLLEAKDYLGALAVFKSAYQRFPSAKILLNIGTTLNLLNRKEEAANTYQKYLDSPDSDPAKQSDVTTVLFELDKSVGKLEINVTPADSEVQINDGEWIPLAAARIYRVPAGKFTVRARKDKFHPEAKSANISTGEKAGIAINLVAIPEAPVITTGSTTVQDPGLVASVEPEQRSKLAGLALVHLDIPRGGAAALVGLGYDISGPFQVQGTAILGPTYGAYFGAAFAFLDGKVRPFAAAGLPMFVSSGIRVGLRGAGGAEIVITKHVSLIAELGAELMLNPEDNILKVAFIPAVGASGRL